MPGLARSVVAVMSARVLGILAAFGFSLVLARDFGADRHTDFFFSAYVVPNLLLVVFGSLLPSVFVGVHTDLRAREGEASARRLTSACLVVFGAIFALLVAVGMVLSPGLARLVGRGFEPEGVARVSRMLFLLLPVVFFAGLAFVVKGVLTARQVFFSPSLDTFVTNGVAVLVTLLLGPRFGLNAVIAGLVLGNVARLLVMLPDLVRREGHPFRLAIWHPEVRRLLELMAPLVVSTFFYALNGVIQRALASTLPEGGAVSALSYAEKVFVVPIDVFAMTLGTVLLPTLARHHTARDSEGLIRTVSSGLRGSSMILVPAAVTLMVLAEPLVRVIYERGRFDPQDTIMVSQVLRVYSISLVFGGFYVMSQAFFAMQDTRSIFWLSLVNTTVILGSSLILIGPLQEKGIALAFSIGQMVTFLLGLFWLRRRLGRIDGGRVVRAMMGTLSAGAIMGVLMMGIVRACDRVVTAHPLSNALVQMGCAGTAGWLLFILHLRIFQFEEWAALQGRWRELLGRRRDS